MRPDNVFRLRSAQGQDYVHVIAWQECRDVTVLRRFMGYLAWLGQRTPDRAEIQQLIVAVIRAGDLPAFERALAQAVAAATS
jgi:hypothetical protein